MKRLIPEWLKDLLTSPTETLSRSQYALRFALEVCRHGARQLRDDRANQMAAALAFRTIFGLIPVIIIALLIFRAFGGGDMFAELIDRMLTAANLHDVAAPVLGSTSQAATTADAVTLATWAKGIVRDINVNISARTVGVIGLLVLAWAAIGLLTTIERSFNTICRAPEHRSLLRRIPLYWTTITLGPALLYLSFQFRGRFADWIEHAGLGETLASLIALGVSFLSVWLLLLCLYSFVPHTRAHLAPTAIGAMLAAGLWALLTHAFGWYIAWSFSRQSSTFTVLYGSLGLIPLFMLWIYFLWLIVLYGLEIAVILQTVHGRMDQAIPERGEVPRLLEPACVIPLVQVIAQRFRDGLPTASEEIVTATRLDERTVQMLLTALTEAGVLHEIERRGERTYALARPPEAIRTDDLLRVAHRLTETPVERSAMGEWLARFRAAQLELEVHKSLANL